MTPEVPPDSARTGPSRPPGPGTPARGRDTLSSPRDSAASDGASGSEPLDRVPEPGLSVASVARSLGVAPATLRTWARRYGLGPGKHVPGAHRRYGPDDLRRLQLMQQALARGVSAGDAARYALGVPLPPQLGSGPDDAARGREAGRGGPAATGVGPEARGGGPADQDAVAAARRGLARSVLGLDEPRVRRLLESALAAVGLVTTWDGVVRPVLGAVAQRWATTGRGVEIEHLLTGAVSAAFAARALPAAGPAAHRPVLLACVPGELHELPLGVLAAVLTERGAPVRLLGADLPAPALGDAVRRLAPAAVVLWAQQPGLADPGLFSTLPRTRPGFRSFAAGPGWTEAGRAVGRVGRLTSLPEAADALSGVTQTSSYM